MKLCIRDLRSIGAAQQGRVKRKLREEIRFYELTYACIHGCKKFKPSGKGARQTSLVALLISNSFKSIAKIKIDSTSNHWLVGYFTKSLSKTASRWWGVLQKVAAKILHIYLSFMNISQYLLCWYVSKIFSRFETFLQSDSVATSKCLLLLHSVFSILNLVFLLVWFFTHRYLFRIISFCHEKN